MENLRNFEPQRSRRTQRLNILFLSLCTLCASWLIFPYAAVAQDEAPQEEPAEAEEDPSVTYSPDFCEFGITFPESPYTVRRCEDDSKERCYDLVSYTQVYDMSSTVNFRVICNPVSPDVYKEYSAEVMELTLKALTKNSVVKQFESSFREEDTYKQAAVVGEGYVGRTPTIYIAQLWIGQQSALSVEAELIGNALPDADTLFSDVLKSVGLKKAEKATPQQE